VVAAGKSGVSNLDVPSGCVAKIMTGAPVPLACDAVVMVSRDRTYCNWQATSSSEWYQEKLTKHYDLVRRVWDCASRSKKPNCYRAMNAAKRSGCASRALPSLVRTYGQSARIFRSGILY
jgi:hypothetical protein